MATKNDAPLAASSRIFLLWACISVPAAAAEAYSCSRHLACCCQECLHQLASSYCCDLQFACTGLPAAVACSLLAPACRRPAAAACSLLAAAAASEGAHLAGQADEGAWAHAGVVAALLLAGDALQDAVSQHITPTTQSILQEEVCMRLVPQ